MRRVLFVTNDFPPRRGGIESFVWSLCSTLDPSRVVVHASTADAAAEFDAAAAFPIVRDPSSTLLPTPATARRAAATMRAHDCDVVVFGAAAPLGLLATELRGAGAVRTIALTHGHETWWARTPLTRRLLRRIGDDNDVLTYVSRHTRDQIAPALSASAADRMRRLSPGVDLSRFHPDVDGARPRREWGIGADRQVVLSASRLVRRKGQDVLLRAWPSVLRERPRAVLVIAGDGPTRSGLERLAARLRLGEAVRFVDGAAWSEMPARFAAADVFALPCRTRRAGLELEALGISFLEAAAVGLPTVVGRSGGAPETVVHGETGLVVDPRDPDDVAAALRRLLADRELARTMGRRGRQFVAREYGLDAMAVVLRSLASTDERAARGSHG
jgi:phosphatidylinositol alpha-1,6-mannosyltransferase